MYYEVQGDTVVYRCDRCHQELHSPLSEAGTRQQCPFCKHEFASPGARELKAIRDAEAIEQEKRDLASELLGPPEPPAKTTIVSVPEPRPEPELHWYGQMYCHKCGYRWQARRNYPPAKCAGCGSRKIEAIREARRGCLAMMLLSLGVMMLSIAGTKRVDILYDLLSNL